jgi:hypothetical protein
MKALHPVVAIAVLMLCGGIPFADAADVTNERPFGGPFPPKRRGIERTGTTCKTPSIICKVPEAQPIGSDCFCRSSDGKLIKGKVSP